MTNDGIADLSPLFLSLFVADTSEGMILKKFG